MTGQGLLSNRSMRLPSQRWIFPSLFCVRLIGALFNTVHDCDEVFNYWEPLHRLLYGYGKQPWEYSPQYALRSYLYILIYYCIALPFTWLFGNGNLKYLVFYSLRCIMALDVAWLESRLVRCLSLWFPEASWIFFVALLGNAGMSMATTTFLPSTFAMRCMMAATVSLMQQNVKGVIWWSVVAVILGWSVSSVAFVPYALYVLMQPQLARSFRQLFGCIAIIFIPLALSDFYFYGQTTVSLLNFVRYNVIGGQSTLYGIESSTFYFRNGLLNFSLLTIGSALFPLIMGIAYVQQRAKHKNTMSNYELSPVNFRNIVLICLPVYFWTLALTSLPHKEERFLYVVYPQICLSASVALVLIERRLLRPLFPDPFGRALDHSFKVGCMVVYLLLSVMRISAVWVNLNAPMHIYRSLPEIETTERVYVCTGDEWHRYPSSFFLPHPLMRLGFLKQEFNGLLPGDFNEDWMGTRDVRSHFNDQNRMDPAHYVDITACTFVVDYEAANNNTLATLYDPNGQWTRLKSLKILDRRRSPPLTRVLHIPYLNNRLNVFGQYVLYQTQPINRLKR